ncbi:hypothetical protein ACFSQT_24060 [Mesorhizobium calcicola]|uniref:Uncharacterized protein n=1 Tax=Mesorhizobium calcicola TaxID=1300310 RepID=A0ABW4WKT0_9HYPH
MVSGILRIIIIGIWLLAAATGTARADFSDGKMPDGVYHCEVYLLGLFLDLGDITIKGNVYNGPVYAGLGTFGTAQQGYNYQMDANGVISWLGPLGGYTAGGNSLSLTQATLDGQSPPSFDIIMKQADGAFTASTCTRASGQ